MGSNLVAWKDIKTSTTTAMTYPFLGHQGVIRDGWMHLLAAHPKVGKTTLLMYMVREWAQTYDIACPDILWLSEESNDVWAERKSAHDWGDLPIEVYYAFGEHHDTLLGTAYWGPHSVIIVDTVSSLMGIPNMNDNAVVATYMKRWINPLRLKKKTVIFVHHMRKSDEGAFGTTVAGAHAFTGCVDVVLEVREDRAIANRRVVTTRSRGSIPPKLVYEYTRGQLVPVGTESDVDVQTYRAGQDPSARAVGQTACSDCGTGFSPRYRSHTLCDTCFQKVSP